MKKYKLRIISDSEINSEINKVGFDKKYLKIAKDKYHFHVIKIKDLKTPAANILKQSALSCSADVAVHYGTINCSVNFTDGILAGTTKQIRQIIEKIKNQPFGLAQLATELEMFIDKILTDEKILKINSKKFIWGDKTYIMGIINPTPDSFSDGGKYFNVNDAIALAGDMVKNGVDILDIGGESTRPYAAPTSIEDQIQRVVPLIKEINLQFPDSVISIDTRSSVVAKAALCAGAHLINDVSGLMFDEQMIDVLCEFNSPIVINHSLDIPEKMQINPNYSDLLDEITEFFYRQIDFIVSRGINEEKIILDPGIGFGKTLEHNLELINRMDEIKSLGFPVLVGISRKKFIADIMETDSVDPLINQNKDDNVTSKDQGTLYINSLLALKGVDILRVHDYKSHIQLAGFYYKQKKTALSRK